MVSGTNCFKGDAGRNPFDVNSLSPQFVRSCPLMSAHVDALRTFHTSNYFFPSGFRARLGGNLPPTRRRPGIRPLRRGRRGRSTGRARDRSRRHKAPRLARQRSRVRGLAPACAAECSVVRQPFRVLPMPVPSSARDSRGALERHLEGPGMDEFAVGEFVHLQNGNIGRHNLPRMSHDPYPQDGSPRASGSVRRRRLSDSAKPGSPGTSTPKRRPERPARLRRANIKSWMARSRVPIQVNIGGTCAIDNRF